MKKIIKLAMLFASIAAGNMQAVVVAGHPQHQTGPVTDMMRIIRPVERHMEKIRKAVSDIHTAKEAAVSATKAASLATMAENLKRKFNPDELRYLSQRLLEGTVMRPIIAEEPVRYGGDSRTWTPRYLSDKTSESAESDARTEKSKSKQSRPGTAEVQGLEISGKQTKEDGNYWKEEPKRIAHAPENFVTGIKKAPKDFASGIESAPDSFKKGWDDLM